MNIIRKGVEKSIEKLIEIPQAVKDVEVEILNFSIKWPPKAY